ncbi:MAG: hypothetical protein ACR2NT_10430 [Acidimicrobiia bacterium]|nr:hypothetical protein [Acidimicrobiia bacterium]MDQ3501614.1 hypothetical protein [Actinomycetota bacterium]
MGAYGPAWTDIKLGVGFIITNGWQATSHGDEPAEPTNQRVAATARRRFDA